MGLAAKVIQLDAHRPLNSEPSFEHVKAQEAMATRNWRQARDYWREALTYDSQDLEAHLGIAHAWEMSNKPGSAIAIYQKILKTVDPGCTEARYGIGVNHLAKGNIEIAAKRFRQVRKREDPYATKAQQELDKLTDSVYTQAQTIINEGGNLKEAIRLLKQVIELDPLKVVDTSRVMQPNLPPEGYGVRKRLDQAMHYMDRNAIDEAQAIVIDLEQYDLGQHTQYLETVKFNLEIASFFAARPMPAYVDGGLVQEQKHKFIYNICQKVQHALRK